MAIENAQGAYTLYRVIKVLHTELLSSWNKSEKYPFRRSLHSLLYLYDFTFYVNLMFIVAHTNGKCSVDSLTYNAHVIILYFVSLSLFQRCAAAATRHGTMTTAAMGLIFADMDAKLCSVCTNRLATGPWICIFICIGLVAVAATARDIDNSAMSEYARIAVVVAPSNEFIVVVFFFCISFSCIFCSRLYGCSSRSSSDKVSRETERNALNVRVMQTKPFYVHKNLHWHNVNGHNRMRNICARVLTVYRMAKLAASNAYFSRQTLPTSPTSIVWKKLLHTITNAIPDWNGHRWRENETWCDANEIKRPSNGS